MSNLNEPFVDDNIEVINMLINDGIEQGYLTYDQILEALPNIENNLMLLENLLEEAQSAGLSVYESEDDIDMTAVAAATAEEATTEGESDDAAHVAPLFDLSNVPIDDSVGLYFREMGQQQLLSAEEEVQLAMEIEAGREAEKSLEEEILDLNDADNLYNIKEIGEAARAHLILSLIHI